MDVEQQSPSGRKVSGRLLTLPNALSVLRLLGLPVFVWAIVDHRDVLALVVLMFSGLTDYLDGKIARRYNMESRLGQFLDPIADRLYIVTTLVGLAWRDIIPVWLVGVLLLREVVMAGMLLYLRHRGQIGMPVHFVGKAATFNLLYAFPFLLVADRDDWIGRLAEPIGWGFAWWGVGLYWFAVVLYAVQARLVLAHSPRVVLP
ncbi:MAG TPA: CDP-alcohol phosphatidyltransferase family protein [Humibacillus sp.]|nr:CDP-alcohol phosphatidyltransferase family protein [Humibacillus sp.]